MLKKGFTILELSMTMVILAISAMIVIPTVMNLTGSTDLENEARKIVEVLREQQQKSISENSSYYGIKINPTIDCYSKGHNNNSGPIFIIDETMICVSDIDIRTFSWNPPNEICFDHLGAPISLDNNSRRIDLEDSEGNVFSVQLTPVTGRIRVLKL